MTLSLFLKKIKYKFLIIKDLIKILVKNFIPQIGDFLLLIFGKKVNKNNWDKRILIIFGGGIGDVVKRSVICNFVNEYLNKDFEVYYLLPYDLKFPFAKDIFYFDYTKAKINLSYYIKLINSLRRIGFSKIIILLPYWENFLAYLGKAIGGEIIFVYKEKAPLLVFNIADKIVKLFRLNFLEKCFYKIDFDKLIYKDWKKDYFPSDVFKMSLFISEVIKAIKKDYSQKGLLKVSDLKTEVLIDEKAKEKISNFLKENNLKEKSYIVIGLGSSSFHKNWPVKNFAEIAKFLNNLGYKIIIVGGEESVKLVELFSKFFNEAFINLVEKTNLEELIVLVKNSLIVISNDTSFVHIAVALKKPSLCIVGYHPGLGADSFYGYEEINKWVFVKNKDVFDVPVDLVKEELISLLNKIKNFDKENFKFQLSFVDKYY
jgi:hypothetical protein